MRTSRFAPPAWVLVGAAWFALAGTAAAEPPLRAARLGYATGTVSFSPAGQPDWVRATTNRPLTTGDRLWTGSDARAELQVGGAAIRLGPRTSVRVLNLDDRIVQLEVTQGTLKVRVRQLAPGQSFEVATPNLALTLRRPGDYRVEVEPDDDATAVTVRSGSAEAYGEGAAYTIDSRRGYRFYGVGLDDYDVVTARRDDDLDHWSSDRDRRVEQSATARYVSTEVVGYEELDGNGTWQVVPDYGPVWTPSRVAAGWTPYRDGHWSWIDPWGWTWVDDAPWGYAVSHYGRWANLGGSWGWVPGPQRERAAYAPALVAFVGGGRAQKASPSVGASIEVDIGWFPLAPREVYRPSYPVSRDYFDNINRSNAVIAPTTITNVYNTTNVTNVTNVVNVTYANRQVPGAVVAVPAQTFAQSQPVARAVVVLSRDAMVAAPVAHVAPVVPVQQSVQGGAASVVKPPVREQAVVARTAPPPPPVPFAVQQQQLAARPGMPIGEAQRAQFKTVPTAARAAQVAVVTAAKEPTPNTAPPATAPAARSPEARRAAAVVAEGASGPLRPRADEKAMAAQAAASRAGTDAARADTAKAEAAKAEASKTEAAKAADAKAAALKSDAARAEAAKADAAKIEATKAAEAKATVAKAAEAKATAAKIEAAKAEAAKAEAAKADAVKADATKAADTKAATAKTEAAKAEGAKAEAARAEAAKAEVTRTEAAKAADAKAAAAKAESAKADAARADAAKAEAARADRAKADAAKADAARADAAKADAARAQVARAAAAKAESDRAEAAKATAARSAVDKAEAARAEAARAAAAKAEASKAETARQDAAKAEAAKAEATRAEVAKAEAAKAEAAKVAAAKAAAAKAEVARQDAGRPVAGKAAPEGPPRGAASAPRGEGRGAAGDDERKPGDESRKRP